MPRPIRWASVPNCWPSGTPFEEMSGSEMMLSYSVPNRIRFGAMAPPAAIPSARLPPEIVHLSPLVFAVRLV